MTTLSQTSFNSSATDCDRGGYSEGAGGLADSGRKVHYRVALDENELLREVRCSEATRSDALLHLLERYEPVAFHISNVLVEDSALAAIASEDACVESVSQMLAAAPMNAGEFRVMFFRNLRHHCARFHSEGVVSSDSQNDSLRSAIRSMPESCRWVSVLKFVAGLSDREISDVLSIPTDRAKALLAMAVQNLLADRSPPNAPQRSKIAIEDIDLSDRLSKQP